MGTAMASRFLCTTCNEPTSALALYHAWLVFLDFTPLRLNYLSGRERDRDRERQRETYRQRQRDGRAGEVNIILV